MRMGRSAQTMKLAQACSIVALSVFLLQVHECTSAIGPPVTSGHRLRRQAALTQKGFGRGTSQEEKFVHSALPDEITKLRSELGQRDEELHTAQRQVHDLEQTVVSLRGQVEAESQRNQQLETTLNKVRAVVADSSSNTTKGVASATASSGKNSPYNVNSSSKQAPPTTAAPVVEIVAVRPTHSGRSNVAEKSSGHLDVVVGRLGNHSQKASIPEKVKAQVVVSEGKGVQGSKKNTTARESSLSAARSGNEEHIDGDSSSDDFAAVNTSDRTDEFEALDEKLRAEDDRIKKLDRDRDDAADRLRDMASDEQDFLSDIDKIPVF
jgi:chromosome segregation ATPase